jgi:predicted transposase/invertase (TIGR01784 family)
VETLLVYKLPRLSREEIRKMLNVLNVELKETRFYQEVFAEGLEEGRQEGQREERLRIARSLLDVIADDRLLAEKTGLSEAEVQALRAQQH